MGKYVNSADELTVLLHVTNEADLVFQLLGLRLLSIFHCLCLLELELARLDNRLSEPIAALARYLLHNQRGTHCVYGLRLLIIDAQVRTHHVFVVYLIIHFACQVHILVWHLRLIGEIGRP